MSCSTTKQILKAAGYIVQVVHKKDPAWLSNASSICETLASIQPCFPLYAEFKGKTDPSDLKKPHVFMNDDAKAKLAEFYLCTAYQLRRNAVENAGTDKTALLRLIEETAQHTVEPFLDQVRSFIDDYDPQIHQALEETTVYETIDKRLFWHHNFLVSAPEIYAKFLESYDEAYTRAGHLNAERDNSDALPLDATLVSKAQEVYDAWIEVSGTPVKGNIKNALIDCGLVIGQRAYETPNKSGPKEANI